MGFRLATVGTALLACSMPVTAWEWRGEAGLEGRYFTAGPGAADYWHNGSAYLQGQLLHEWNDRRDLFTFTPFYRIDENDDQRTHGDIRELMWIHVADQWESRIGIGKVFWGVTEGRHLVDIINQTDAVEQQDMESKLGQPMINLSVVRDWGTLDFYLLPGFRERTYGGVDGRPSLPLPVESDAARYASSAEDKRIDGAVRWQQMFGSLQIALSHFSGTGREPLLFVNLFEFQFEPYYPVIEQSGMELQYLLGGWLFKAEAIRRSGNRFERAMHAADVGFEFTQPGVFGSGLDLGWIAEYLWEDRDERFVSPFASDVLVGNRLTFNDIASTELLWGLIWDPDSGDRIYTLESSRRFGSQWRATLEGQFYSRIDASPGVPSPLSVFADEDMIQLEVIRYF
ncbi:hypothetical protein [Alcanivorax sp. 1008]|uniref:hypothetical protein n=1 Tax=Alcanivorax sp. 1008 TaxID=2816853 RepID=UPI001D7CC5D4|nr:hypothetical protein [Alcanivorax sp. 1008]MCC1498331.1 hypothetical protein [Alcanivorax sp. 1008]